VVVVVMMYADLKPCQARAAAVVTQRETHSNSEPLIMYTVM
jgi:hypothetical protein